MDFICQRQISSRLAFKAYRVTYGDISLRLWRNITLSWIAYRVTYGDTSPLIPIPSENITRNINRSYIGALAISKLMP